MLKREIKNQFKITISIIKGKQTGAMSQIRKYNYLQ